jgi:hypothetical protein
LTYLNDRMRPMVESRDKAGLLKELQVMQAALRARGFQLHEMMNSPDAETHWVDADHPRRLPR